MSDISGHYVRSPVKLRYSRFFSFCEATERALLDPSVSIIKSVLLSAMPTNHNNTCAAAFLFLDGSAVLAFAQGGASLFSTHPIVAGGGDCKLDVPRAPAP